MCLIIIMVVRNRISLASTQSQLNYLAFLLTTFSAHDRSGSFKQMSSSNSPCAACKFLRRKCTQECVFAPYFPADNPSRFANVHKVFGASNVAKILNELDTIHREDAVNSLAYEAELRLKDPVYGCVGVIQFLHNHLKQIHVNLELAKKELVSMVGPATMHQMLQNPNFLHPMAASPAAAMVPYNMMMAAGPGPGPGPGPLAVADFQQDVGPAQMIMRDGSIQQPQQQQQPHQMMMIRDAQLHQDPHQNQHHHHGIDAQQLAVMQVREEQEIMRNFEQLQQQQQQQMMRFNGNGYETGGEFCQQPLLALGTGFDGNPYQAQQQQQQQPLLLLQQPKQSDSEVAQNMEQAEQLQFHEQPDDPGNTMTGGQSC